ncbi:GYD domain-containing protein [Halopiger djelfimassiliensis]|uniref:GYD domain-containing protein n=1 Tax=Halopiger djelfimassiliensis TaxID=1293047 RepID=UPI000677975D|nr:GYD domain-containing protein [Halopiger djelfimassiliensis]
MRHELAIPQQGAQTVKESPDRVDRIAEQFEEMGDELRECYLLLGRFDTITISGFPDDETAAQAILAVTEQGNVSSETVKAFSREAMRDLIAGLP